MPFLFLWDCSTIMQWSQGSWYKNLLTVSHARLVVTLHSFYKNQIILAEPQCSYCFYKFLAHLFLFCSCDNNNFWPCIRKWLVWRKHCIYNLILKFVSITFCLLAEPCSWRFWWHRPYFIVKFPQSLCILFIHCSFLYEVSIDLIYFSSLKVFGSLHPAWLLFLNWS